MPSSSKRSATAGSSRSGSGMNADEKVVWQAAMSRPNNTLTDLKDIELDIDRQLAAINGLLRKSLFTASKVGGAMHYTAVSKGEASVMGSMEGDEGIIYSLIKDSGTEGIWTKQLKTRSNLHQSVMTRCLKNLEQKQLVKVVKSVKFPTRKIYMLYGLTPSVELSGGPWYTDNELDTAFIEQLCLMLYRHIANETWPSSDAQGNSLGPLYPASHTAKLPTAPACLRWLKARKVTDIPLGVEDVQSLLDVLVFDEKIEKIPCMPGGGDGGGGKKVYDADYRPGSVDGMETQSSSSSSSGSDSGSESGSDSGSDNGSESGSDSGRSSGSASSASGSESGSGSDASSRSDSRKRKRKSSSKSSRKRSKSSSSSKKRHKSSSRKSSHSSRKHHSSSRKRSRSRSSSKRHGSKKKHRHKSSSRGRAVKNAALGAVDGDDDDVEEMSTAAAGMYVYRALKPLAVHVGWSETPCGACPVFDFCEPGGPVNAEGCAYMAQWLEVQHAGDEPEPDSESDNEDAAGSGAEAGTKSRK